MYIANKMKFCEKILHITHRRYRTLCTLPPRRTAPRANRITCTTWRTPLYGAFAGGQITTVEILLRHKLSIQQLPL